VQTMLVLNGEDGVGVHACLTRRGGKTKGFESVEAFLPMRNCAMIRAFDQALSDSADLAKQNSEDNHVSFFSSFCELLRVCIFTLIFTMFFNVVS
jgi:hypothetical protein